MEIRLPPVEGLGPECADDQGCPELNVGNPDKLSVLIESFFSPVGDSVFRRYLFLRIGNKERRSHEDEREY